MTKKEIEQWIKNATFVNGEQYESDGNYYKDNVYEKDGELFLLHFCNDSVCQVYINGKGFQKGVYEPIKIHDVHVEKIVSVFIHYLDENGKTLAKIEQYEMIDQKNKE